jgi:hypothetical protein
MDLKRLRSMLVSEMLRLKELESHQFLAGLCEELGMPPPGMGSKRDRMLASLEATPDADLTRLARRILDVRPPSPNVRNAIQDVLWTDAGYPTIQKKYRRLVAQALESEDHYIDSSGFDALVDRLWILMDDMVALWGSTKHTLAAEIQQHVHRNPDDWTAEYLFDRLGAFEATDRRFALFLEGLVSADVRPDEGVQRRVVQKLNTALTGSGLELRETDSKDGYPTFELVSTRAGAPGRPKNLIFASSVKPDLRFRDAISNDVEIVTHADKVLIYDQPIPAEGLRWKHLQTWWSKLNNIVDAEQAKRSLYRRLQESVPESSPPQHLLFTAYHTGFGQAVPNLPALLPEVWLHWDPKTVTDRGREALLRQRMDFLMLLPNGYRVVIEVDGSQHYSSGKGTADPSRYASMVAADRDLKLLGYEVFRFGGTELQGTSAHKAVKTFFELLFRRFSVPC